MDEIVTPTPYNKIFDRFIKKLRNDKNFLDYTGLTDEEIEPLVKDHCIDLLDQAIGMIYAYGNPDVDLNDKDNEELTFNIELVIQEIDLFANLMHFKYFEEDKNKLRAFGVTFNTKELNVFSPANDRKTFNEMVDKMEKDNIGSIDNYLSRDRKTWKMKSVM